jgi:hypothetical protein
MSSDSTSSVDCAEVTTPPGFVNHLRIAPTPAAVVKQIIRTVIDNIPTTLPLLVFERE